MSSCTKFTCILGCTLVLRRIQLPYGLKFVVGIFSARALCRSMKADQERRQECFCVCADPFTRLKIRVILGAQSQKQIPNRAVCVIAHRSKEEACMARTQGGLTDFSMPSPLRTRRSLVGISCPRNQSSVFDTLAVSYRVVQDGCLHRAE